jgi:hypothetical protein
MSQAQQVTPAQAAQSLVTSPTFLNVNFEGLIGPQGPPGPPGPAGLPGISVEGGIGEQPVPPAGISADFPITDGIEFSTGTTNQVTWTAGTLWFQGTSYEISSGNATASGAGIYQYIYWDEASSPTTLHNTETLATAAASGRWIIAINLSGSPSQPFQNKVLQAGIIQADTIVTNHLIANAVTTPKITDESTAVYDSAITTGYTAYLDISSSPLTVQTLSFAAGNESIGDIVVVTGSAIAEGVFSTPGYSVAATLELWKGSVLVDSVTSAGLDYQDKAYLSLSYSDYIGSASTETYYLKAYAASNGRIQMYNRVLRAEEPRGK